MSYKRGNDEEDDGFKPITDEDLERLPPEVRRMVEGIRATGHVALMREDENRIEIATGGHLTPSGAVPVDLAGILRQLTNDAAALEQGETPLTPGHPVGHDCLMCQVNGKFKKINEADISDSDKFAAAIAVLRSATAEAKEVDDQNMVGAFTGQRLLIEAAKVVSDEGRAITTAKIEAGMQRAKSAAKALAEIDRKAAPDTWQETMEALMLEFAVLRVWLSWREAIDVTPEFQMVDRIAEAASLSAELVADPVALMEKFLRKKDD